MDNRYDRTAISLHWLVALGIIGTFSLGVYMHDLPLSPTKLQLYSWHKWAGVTLFLLAIVRLAWRIAHPAPPLPAAMPALQRAAAQAAHWVLYALMLMIPISGWLMSSAKGFQTVWFGVLPLPDLVAKDAELGDLLLGVHKALNFTLLAVVVAHVGAALKHHFIDRDDVLTRMLPATQKS
ncbi:cytochrome b [Thauera sinica]|uniref:Cytochrome b n=1 Tax=Thauera sinica TaxID=2665146 RepID=A0ABW1ASL2_9RHOO|nr:cytochrome b [Thauera sp. K11]ATE61126.1 cytochrome b [Thauera sp. K11]